MEPEARLWEILPGTGSVNLKEEDSISFIPAQNRSVLSSGLCSVMQHVH